MVKLQKLTPRATRAVEINRMGFCRLVIALVLTVAKPLARNYEYHPFVLVAVDVLPKVVVSYNC